MSDYLDLYDYRRYVFSMYDQRRKDTLAGVDPLTVFQIFHKAKNELFAHHPQTALTKEQLHDFHGLHYFPYNPAMRFIVDIDTNVEPIRHSIAMDAKETMTMTTVGYVHFIVDGEPVRLSIYWLNIYGGGLFLPFRDATCPVESYGGGRYLFDTIKGSDFLTVTDEDNREHIVLDFNYAYNPSCSYNDRSVCPLAPVENHLKVAIRAGEKKMQ
jgi:uncharacterized protein (DUF1684 family)